MATLPLRRTPGVVALVVNRVYKFTPLTDCAIGIGPEAGGRVAMDHRYAQLQAGVTYEFATSATDRHLTVLSRHDVGDLTYINDRPRT